MKRAIIFANGDLGQPAIERSSLPPAAMVIAADGGAQHCKSLGIIPDVLIGDLDSLEPRELSAYRQARIEIIQHPSHKDETDLELALQLAVSRGVDEVYILGALGQRWDMTIANVLMMAQPALAGVKIHLMDGNQEFLLVRGGEIAKIRGTAGETISLIPLAGDACGITTHGLEYPLKNETLRLGSPRGVSNIFLKEKAEVEIKEGLLLCIFNRMEE